MCPLVLLEPQNENDSFLRAKQHLQFLEEAAELEVNSVIVITGGLSPENSDIKGQRQNVIEELEHGEELPEGQEAEDGEITPDQEQPAGDKDNSKEGDNKESSDGGSG